VSNNLLDVTEPEETQSKGKSMPKRQGRLWLCGIVLVVFTWNALVSLPVARAIYDEKGAITVAYRRWLVSPTQIVFDVWSVDSAQSKLSMDRRLFKSAEALQNQSYESVVLAYHGKPMFVMEGAYFQEIGVSRQSRNPIYTIRTMQERLRYPNGATAFEVRSGGWLGVLGKQLDDHNEFHDIWWVNAQIGHTDSSGAANYNRRR
jgi:hypothetical protein